MTETTDDLTISEYADQAAKTADYPYRGAEGPAPYPFLGLPGEAGEVAEQAKKMIRDDDGFLTDGRREKIIKELGDVLWYVAAICDEINVDLQEVARRNVEKLADRAERDVIRGEGDDR